MYCVTKFNNSKMVPGCKLFLLLMLFLSMGLFSQTHAQTYIDVAPDNYPVERGNLNRAVEEHGAEGVIFRLERDAVYWTDGVMVNVDYELVIEAEEGDGHIPIMRPAVDMDFQSYEFAQSEHNLTIRNVYLGGLDDQGNWRGRIRLRTDDTRMTLEGIYMDYNGCILIRTDGENISLFASDSQFRHIGQTTDPSCGRVWDSRGNNVDSIVFVNNTMYLGTHFPLRTFGGTVNYMEMNHNTIVDWGYHLEIGLTKELVFTNNHMINIGWRGPSGRDGVGYADHSILTFMEADPIEAFNDEDRNLIIRNNNLGSMRPEYVQMLQDHWDAHWQAEGDSVAFTEEPAARPFIHDQVMDTTGYNLMAMGVLVYEDNILEEESELQFTDRPDWQNVVEYQTAYLADPSQTLPLPWDRRETLDGDDDVPPFSGAQGVDQWRDFSYSTSAQSYTAGIGGLPIGDLNWFPDKKAEWEAMETSVEDVAAIEQPEAFTLVGNYPNPFNPTTNIEYQLAETMDVTMTVFNSLGQKVDQVALGTQSAGTHSVSYDASQLSSGMYIVRMDAGNLTQSIKITLIK